MHFTRLCDNCFHDYGSPGKVVAIFDLCKWGRKNAPMTCVPILNHLVCKEVCMCHIICFYPNLQYQALFELLTAPLLRVDGPKASQRSIITYEIHFCTDQVKTHREVWFWFDLSYDATKVHGQMLRIKFGYLILVCFLPKSVAQRPCLQNGGNQNTWHLGQTPRKLLKFYRTVGPVKAHLLLVLLKFYRTKQTKWQQDAEIFFGQ